MQTIYHVTQRVSALAGTVLLTAARVDAECKATIRDHVGWGLPPDLVNYSFRASKSELKRLRVFGPDGAPLAVQTATDAEGGVMPPAG